MAYASVRTLIPLDNVAKILQIDPLHFNSIHSDLRPERNACDDMYAQYDWQLTGRVSRESIAMALKQAEDVVVHRLGYYPVPTWIQAEEVDMTRPFKPELSYASNLNIQCKRQSVTAKYGYFIEGGRQTKELVEADSAVTYSDPDGDGYNETATVTAVVTTTEPSEVRIYYPGKSGKDTWEIRPINVSISAGTATITFRKYQAPLEDLIEKLAESPGENYRTIDGDNDANFLTTVDVYYVYNDPSQQLNFLTEEFCLSCGGTGCTACEGYSEAGCMYPRDRRNSILAVTRANWNEDDETFSRTSFTYCRVPDKVQIWYRAGWRNLDLDEPLIQMDPTWERLIVFYSLTLLDTELCGCDNTARIVSYQRQDLARPTSQGAFAISARDLACPLGTTVAGLNLWHYIESPGTRLVRAR